jgi:Ca2+-binding RTX toxin-like protein
LDIANVITGTASAETLTGTTGRDWLYGLVGNDTLKAGAGNDMLDGGVGADVLDGGSGDDIYFVDATGDSVVETTTTTTYVDQGQYVTTYVDQGYYYGSVTYDESGQPIYVVTWVPVMVPQTYWVPNVVAQTTVSDSGGIDTVNASIAYVLGTNQENLTLTGTAANLENLVLTGTVAINGTGNALDNVLTGNSAVNTLNGGAGADTLIGGAGNDIYVADALDTVVENANEGTDTVNADTSFTLGANLENLTLTGTGAINGTGNALNNVLTGNTAANVLDGAAGADTLTGGAGNDTYVVDASDTIVENANEGTDTVNAGFNYTLGTNLENLVLTGSAAINGTGNALNNMLTGNSGNNTLNGGAGNDTLDGGTGTDTLEGGIGNDSYLLGRGSNVDTINENDSTAGNTDAVTFLSSVAVDQIWFRQVNNDLEASIVGTDDKVIVSNWYLGAQYRVEEFKTTDGSKTLLASQVQNLVSAMAAFSPPAAGQTGLPANYSTALASVIAANWQ